MGNFVLKTKNAIKKVAAISSGALLATTTFGAALADLSDYPSPFVNAKGQWAGLLVVGADAAPADVIGATNIAAALGQQTVVGPGSGPTVSGGKREDILLATAFNASGNFASEQDDDDLAGFFDGSINIDIGNNEEDYDAHDILCIGASTDCVGMTQASPRVDTALTESATPDEDWKDSAFVKVSSDQIKYYFVFDEALAATHFLNESTDDDSVVIDFLGQKLEITDGSASSITAQVGVEYFLNVDDTVTVMGHTVTLINVGTDDVVVLSVDGVQETVSGTEKVGALRFKVKETFDSDTKAERSATLIIGEDATKTYNDGDEYIGEDEDDPTWVWDLGNITTADPTLGVEYDKNLDDPEDQPPSVGDSLGGGDSFELPGGYATINLEGFTETDYKMYTFDSSTEEVFNSSEGTIIIGGTPLSLQSSARLLRISAAGGEQNGFSGGSLPQDTDEIYLGTNASTPTALSVFYKDHDSGKVKQMTEAGPVIASGSQAVVANIDYQDTSIPLVVALLASGKVNITLDMPANAGSDLVLQATSSGATGFDGDNYNNLTLGTTSLSGLEEDTLSQGGIRVVNPDGAFDSTTDRADSLEFDINGDVNDFTVNVLISGPGTRVTGGSGGSSSLGGVAIARLDTEVSSPGAQNVISVGGSAVNRVSAQALGLSYPTFGAAGADALGIGPGEGTLKLIDNAFGGSNTALVVAGYDAADTRNAAGVLQDFSAYAAELTGDQVIVRSEAGVVTVSAPSVASA